MKKYPLFKSFIYVCCIALFSSIIFISCSKEEPDSNLEDFTLEDALGTYSGRLVTNKTTLDAEIKVSKVNENTIQLKVKQGESYSIPTVFTVSVTIDKKDGIIISDTKKLDFSYFIKDNLMFFTAKKDLNPEIPFSVIYEGSKK